MVVAYPSAAEGSCCGFFFDTPRLLIWRVGSVIPDCLIQVLITVGLGILSSFWNPLKTWLPENSTPLDAYNVMGFLISFLLVFKTQSAYNQWWEAITHVDQMMVIYREIGMSSCTIFDWEHGPEVKQYSRKLMRLLVLHFHVVVEYFRRTGSNKVKNSKEKDRLRANVMRLTGPNEYQVLYPGEETPIKGSESLNVCSSPTIVVLWMDLVMARCFKAGGCLSAPHAASLSSLTAELMQRFEAMNQIDKTQFPLPYAQIVKWLVTMWIFSLPFVLELSCGPFTPAAMALISLAVFGLDEVAEILESPFGIDPNDINLEELEEELVNDLELMYYGCSMRVDVVFTDETDLCLRGISSDGIQIHDVRVEQATKVTRASVKKTAVSKFYGRAASPVPGREGLTNRADSPGTGQRSAQVTNLMRQCTHESEALVSSSSNPANVGSHGTPRDGPRKITPPPILEAPEHDVSVNLFKLSPRKTSEPADRKTPESLTRNKSSESTISSRSKDDGSPTSRPGKKVSVVLDRGPRKPPAATTMLPTLVIEHKSVGSDTSERSPSVISDADLEPDRSWPLADMAEQRGTPPHPHSADDAGRTGY